MGLTLFVSHSIVDRQRKKHPKTKIMALRIRPTIYKTFTWLDLELNVCSVRAKRGADGEGEFKTEKEAQEDHDAYLFSRF